MTPSNLAIFREQYAPRTTRVVNTPDGTVTVYSALAVGVIDGKSRTIRALVCEEIGTEDRWFLVTLFVSGKYAQTVAVLGATSSEQAEEWVKRQFSYEYQGEHTSACSLASNGSPLTASADALQEYLDSAAAGVMDLPIHSADISAFEGKITDRPVGWNQDILISHATMADLIHELARRDKQGMMMDAMTADDLPMLVSELGGEVPEFDAIIVDYNRLELMQERLMTAMHKASTGMEVKPVTVQQTKPFKRSGVTNVAVMYELSDGQTVTIVFHSPDATPAKLGPRDTLTSWKWLLNKRDVTAAVAPDNGMNVQLPVLAKRIMMVAAKNSARFKRTNAKKSEQVQALNDTTSRIEQKTATLDGINAEIDSLQKQIDAGVGNADSFESAYDPMRNYYYIRKIDPQGKIVSTVSSGFKTKEEANAEVDRLKSGGSIFGTSKPAVAPAGDDDRNDAIDELAEIEMLKALQSGEIYAVTAVLDKAKAYGLDAVKKCLNTVSIHNLPMMTRLAAIYNLPLKSNGGMWAVPTVNDLADAVMNYVPYEESKRREKARRKIVAGPISYSRKITIPKHMVSGSEPDYYVENRQTVFKDFRISVADSGRGPYSFVEYDDGDGNWLVLKVNALEDRHFEPVAAKARELWDEYMAKQDQGDLLGSDESPDAKPANDGRLTPDTAGNLKRGDVVRTADGQEFLALGSRHDWLEVAPIVNGKPQVNNQDTFKFLLTPEKASAYPERRNEPVYLAGRNLYENGQNPAKTVDSITADMMQAFAADADLKSRLDQAKSRMNVADIADQMVENWFNQNVKRFASSTDMPVADLLKLAPQFKAQAKAKLMEMAGGAGDDMQEYLSTALQDALFDTKAPDDFGAVFDPEVQNPRYLDEGKMSGFLVRQDRADAADSDLVELMLTVSSNMTGTVTPYYGKNGKPGTPVKVYGDNPSSLGDALTTAAKGLLAKSAEAPAAAGKPVSSAASKKFDRMIKVAADSVETLRPVDLDRVFDEAKSPDEMLELAKYIAAKRPELAGRVESYFADMLKEKGWNKTTGKVPTPPDSAPATEAKAVNELRKLFKVYEGAGIKTSVSTSGAVVRVSMTTTDGFALTASLLNMTGKQWVLSESGSSSPANIGEQELFGVLKGAVSWLNGNAIKIDSRLFKEDPKWSADSGTDAPWRAEIAAAGKPAASQQAASAGGPQDWHTEVPTEGLPMLPKERDNTMPGGLITARIATDAVKAITQTQKIGNVGLYAYYLPSKPNTGRHGIVRLFPDDQKPGSGWKQLDSQVFRIGMMTDSQIKERILDKLKSAQVLGYDDQPAAAPAPAAKTAANPDKTMLESIISGATSAADVDMDDLIAIAEKYDGNPDMEGLVNQALEVVTQYELEAAKAIG